MIKILNYLNSIKQYTSHFLSKIKLKEENHSTFLLAFIFISVTFSLGILFYFNIEDHNQITFYFSIIILILFSELSLMLLFMALHKINLLNKSKLMRFVLNLLTVTLLIAIILSFLPISLTYIFIHKIKFYNLYKHFMLYNIAFVVSLIINFIAYVTLPSFFSKFPYINWGPIVFVCMFIIHYLIMSLSGVSYFKVNTITTRNKYKKGKINLKDLYYTLREHYNDKNQYKREIYILNFVVIALFTTFAYCTNTFTYMESFIITENINYFKNSILYAFSIFIAFDRVYDKWKKNLK